MTKISIVTHRTGLRTDVVFHGPTDRAIEFYKAFSQPGEISLFVCNRADRTKKLKATEPEAEVRPPSRKKLL
jgi:hypothetical protein